MTLNKQNFQEVGGGDNLQMWQQKGVDLKVGDSVEGRYIEKKNVKVNGMDKTIYVLEREQGNIGVWGSAVLDSKFAQIAVGKMVGIEYLGKKKGKQVQPYNDFYVAVGIDYAGDEGEIGATSNKNTGDVKAEDLPF